jgi:hypothetical protein
LTKFLLLKAARPETSLKQTASLGMQNLPKHPLPAVYPKPVDSFVDLEISNGPVQVLHSAARNRGILLCAGQAVFVPWQGSKNTV